MTEIERSRVSESSQNKNLRLNARGNKILLCGNEILKVKLLCNNFRTPGNYATISSQNI